MKSFAEAWPDPAILQRLIGKLPWGQNIELLAVKDPAARLWYAEAVLENGWSRPVLAGQIDTNSACAARQGADELFADTAAGNLGPGAAGAERPLPVRLPDPAHGRSRARSRTSPRHPGQGPAARVGKRVFIHRQPASSRSRRARFLCRPALLSSPAALPRRR